MRAIIDYCLFCSRCDRSNFNEDDAIAPPPHLKLREDFLTNAAVAASENYTNFKY